MQKKLLDEVSESRPLAKLQEELEEQSEAVPSTDTNDTSSDDHAKEEVEGSQTGDLERRPDQDAHAAPTLRKPLLNDNDHELDRLARVSLRVPD